jgi:hypothetical protein
MTFIGLKQSPNTEHNLWMPMTMCAICTFESASIPIRRLGWGIASKCHFAKSLKKFFAMTGRGIKKSPRINDAGRFNIYSLVTNN